MLHDFDPCDIKPATRRLNKLQLAFAEGKQDPDQPGHIMVHVKSTTNLRFGTKHCEAHKLNFTRFINSTLNVTSYGIYSPMIAIRKSL